MDGLGIKISGLTFLGLVIIFFGLESDSIFNKDNFMIVIYNDQKPIDVQTHRVTSNCNMIYHFYSSTEIFLNAIRCDKEPSYQEWRHLMRYNELVNGQLSKDFSKYVSNQLLSGAI